MGAVVRLGFDRSIVRHPYGGTTRYAEELLAAMVAQRGSDLILESAGWPRRPAGGTAPDTSISLQTSDG